MTDRASAEELREAARAMWYVHTEDQRFAGPVSADPYGDFERALLAALRDTGPRPDSGIEPHEHDHDCQSGNGKTHRHEYRHTHPVEHLHRHEHPTDEQVARRIALSTPRTETSE